MMYRIYAIFIITGPTFCTKWVLQIGKKPKNNFQIQFDGKTWFFYHIAWFFNRIYFRKCVYDDQMFPWFPLSIMTPFLSFVAFHSNEIKVLFNGIYRRPRKFKHPISKILQWLAWESEVWVGHGWSYILLCLGPFLYANFQEKNLRENFWKKWLNFSL